jgi:hypothetical protein
MTAKHTLRRKRFNESEDETIKLSVSRHGTQAWQLVAADVGNGRTRRQVRERYNCFLNPTHRHETTRDEDEHLIRLHDQYGDKWGRISAEMERQWSPIWLRNRWNWLHNHPPEKPNDDHEIVDNLDGLEPFGLE